MKKGANKTELFARYCEMRECGKTQTECATTLNVSDTTTTAWAKKYKEISSGGKIGVLVMKRLEKSVMTETPENIAKLYELFCQLVNMERKRLNLKTA